MATTFIVGLGNPGVGYERTRHNLGTRAVLALHKQLGDGAWRSWSKCQTSEHAIGGSKLVLLLPQTFMNESGSAVAEVASYLKLEPQFTWLVHDDLDLPLGSLRISVGSSSGGHRGVASVIATLGTSDFTRFRLGIGRPPQGSASETFVLEPFTATEEVSAAELAERTAPALIRLALAKGLPYAQSLCSAAQRAENPTA